MAYDRALSSSWLETNLLLGMAMALSTVFMAVVINPHTWDVVKYDIGSVRILYRIKKHYMKC